MPECARSAAAMGQGNVEFHDGLLEDLPVEHGFVDIAIGPAADTFGGAGGEKNARAFVVFGYPFLARKP